MTEDTAAFFAVWMLIMAAFGFIIGWALGDELCRRRCAEEQVEELRERLEESCSHGPDHNHQLKQMRSVLNDAHKHILAVSKGLEKQPR